MKFGLVGTGYWARVTHGAALVRDPGVELVGVWGRHPDKTTSLASELGCAPYNDYAALLNDVDAVAFAVAPDVQGRMAIDAANAGKHLMLDKPITTNIADAAELVAAVERSGVASVVFFTFLFAQPSREWMERIGEKKWHGGWARFLTSVFDEGSPYDSPWRREKGALWDLGPHALSILAGGLGPIVAVKAEGGAGNLAHLILRHESGATSTATLTLEAPSEAIDVEMTLWGESGIESVPGTTSNPVDAFTTALHDLMSNVAASTTRHPCDVHFGEAITRILADAEAQISKNDPH
ncbi:MAG TPA: Gfo/Idh/MocA family oxidoreductase [Acidimicrobiales bacterium]